MTCWGLRFRLTKYRHCTSSIKVILYTIISEGEISLGQIKHAKELEPLMPTSVKLKVFTDLTLNKKMFLTDGLKFGADFLAYQGDPLIYHAKYLVKI
jgi:tRNA splicing endonuclease